MENLIGREVEKKILKEALHSQAPELIALFGRRRVGKTFLVRQYYAEYLAFEFTGTREAKLSQQLQNFVKALGKAAGNDKLYRVPDNWSDAFDLLTHLLTAKVHAEKAVVFLDEFPWLNTHKSGFLTAFDHWWNSWGTRQSNLVIVICGSAASWMIKNVVNSKGGLHNRITRKIRLLPFTLHEAAKYLEALHVNMERYHLLQIYMVMGGIPHYLKEVKKGESATQAIDRICFSKDGLLHEEFKNLYHSLFDDVTRHLKVVRALSANKTGLTRNQIMQEGGLSSGGTVTELLEELIESGFVTGWLPYDRKSKDTIYKLADEYTHFYLKFMENNRSHGSGAWERFSTSQSWRSWSGIAFERVCLKHIQQLKKAIGIAAVYTEESAWRYQPKTGKGAQIDLLIDRKDFAINICEMKYTEKEFTVDKAYAGELENKRNVFKEATKTRKSLFLTLITTFGVQSNDYVTRSVQTTVTMDALFD
jgi:AAA+ ATPase superfamily predicted ATPase